jgi:tetrahydromethanopterin S-methyltransferase subunit D
MMGYVVVAAGAAIIIVLSYLIWDKRYKSGSEEIPAGFERTDEVNIDPVTKVKTRVYYNAGTGERMYLVEKTGGNA